MIIKNSRIIIF